jgi:hypothetical protein
VVEDHEKTGGLNIKSVGGNILHRRTKKGVESRGSAGKDLPYRDCYTNSTFGFKWIEQAGAVAPLD